jgi:hypothetical protein
MSVANLNGGGLSSFTTPATPLCGIANATSSSAGTIITIPGLVPGQSQVLVSMCNPDQITTKYIQYGLVSAQNELTVGFNTVTSASTTAKIAWFVPVV